MNQNASSDIKQRRNISLIRKEAERGYVSYREIRKLVGLYTPRA